MKLRQHSLIRLGLSGALVALSSLAAFSCGDDASPPPDARRTPDASRPPDARWTPDASRPPDATVPPDARDLPDAARVPPDAATAFCGAFPDSLEPNDSVDAARTVAPGSVSNDPGWVYGDWFVGACVGGTNQDWYRFNASEIPFHTGDDFDGRVHMRLRASIKNTGVCAGPDECNGHVLLPEAPENTLTVSVYRASSMELLYTETSARGVVAFDRASDALLQDIFVSVSGPAEALYDYRLSIFMDVTGGEDECEC